MNITRKFKLTSPALWLVLAASLASHCVQASNTTDPGQQDGDYTTLPAENPSTTSETTIATAEPVSISASELTLTNNRPEKNRGAYLYRGFHHEWLRNVLGFRVPHRISKFFSYINNEAHTLEGSWTSNAIFNFAQSTGVDGNYMKPVGYYSAAYSDKLYVSRSNMHLTWSDSAYGTTYPKADSILNRTITIDLNKEKLGYAALDNYTVILRGIKLDTNCVDSKQPDGTACNSNGMWPYKMQIEIGDCSQAGTELLCPLSVDIRRAWTPNKGGLPGIEEKPFNRVLDFDLRVYYTVLGGNSGDFAFTKGSEVIRTGTARENSPKSGSRSIYGDGGYAKGMVALKGYGFTFSKYGSANKNNHLGRYIGGMKFKVSDSSYSSSTGKLTYSYEQQVWVPDTVVNTNVSYSLKPVLLQFNSAEKAGNKSATGSICVNSNGAPFFSKWQKCGSGDKGPAQSEDNVTIVAP